MCGITGWIDFSARSWTDERRTLEAMTDALSHRGPDDRGLWIGRRGGLGHRRLAVLDPLNNRQPFVERTPQGEVVLVFSGEVYNFQELRRELEATGHRFSTSGDTEVVLRSYLEWGESCVERFSGMFGFGIWDGRHERLWLVRDRLGIKPLYYYPLERGILFGSEPKALLCHPCVEAAVDADGLRQLFGLVRPPGAAVFRGMFEIKPGHSLTLRDGGYRETRYWALSGVRHEDGLETTIEKTRDLLARVVSEQLVSDVPLCILLSGGLDSSTLTALAQREMTRAGTGAARTFSVTFGMNPAAFEPDAMRLSSDDPFVDAVAAKLETRHRAVEVSASELFAKKTRAKALRARDLPTLGEIDSTLLLLFRAVRSSSTVALSGEGADELFGGYRWFHEPTLVAQPAFPWLAMARSLGRYSMFEPAGLSLDIAAYQADAYAAAIAEVPVVEDETPLERRMREISFLHLTRFLPTPLERKDRMSMAVGLEVRVPYVDHRLVEYVFNVPWAMKTFDGREKSLLRAAAGSLVPSSVALREKSAFPATQDPAYHAVLSEEAKQLLADSASPVLDLISRAKLRALASMPATGAPVVRMALERVLGIHEWLTRYEVSLCA